MTEIVLPILGGGASIPVYDTFADFPPVATNGQLAIAADTDNLYIFDGDTNSWNLIGPMPAIVAGDMISVENGYTISVDLATVSGLRSTDPGQGKLQVQLEASNPSLQIDGTNALGVAVDPAGTIVKNTDGIGIQLEASNPTLQITSNALGVKLDPALAIVTGIDGIGIQLETTDPTLQIIDNELGVKLNSGGALTAVTGGIDVATNSITNSLLAQVPANTLKGNNTGSTADAIDLSVSDVQTMLGLQPTWQSYIPTITGFGSAANVVGAFKRIGDSLHLQISFTAGIVTSTLGSVSLPSSLTLSTSTSKIPLNNTTAQAGQVVGTYFASNTVGSTYNSWNGAVLTAPATSTTVVYMGLTTAGVGNPLIAASANKACDTGSVVSLRCEVVLT